MINLKLACVTGVKGEEGGGGLGSEETREKWQETGEEREKPPANSKQLYQFLSHFQTSLRLNRGER